MRTYLKIKSPWVQLSVFLFLLGGAVVLTAAISTLLLASRGITIGPHGVSQQDLDSPAAMTVLKLAQGLSSITNFLLPAALYASFSFRYRPMWFLGFHKPDKNIFYVLAVGLTFLSFPFAAWLGQVNEHIALPASLITMEKDLDRQMEAFLKIGSPLDSLFNLVIIALLPAICEEALFRGSLQRILIHASRRPWIGIIAAAIFFSAFHFEFQGFLPRFFLGVILGALYWYSGSLWVSILAHFVINGVQVLAAGYYPTFVNKNPSVPIYMALVSAVIVGLFLRRLVKESWMTYAKVYEVDAVNEHNQFLS